MLYLGKWQDTLKLVEVDCIITDPPYGVRTHRGWNKGEKQVRTATGQSTRSSITYDAMSPTEVFRFVDSWAPRCRGWMAAMTSHDLISCWEQAYRDAGRLSFAPVPIIQKRPRLLGDGPSSWAVYLMVSRPRTRKMASWGCLPGCYESPTDKKTGIAGAKPVGLMQAIVRDYSKVGDVVCDPYAGGGSTSLAAMSLDRKFVGSELNESHYEIAMKRISERYTADMFNT